MGRVKGAKILPIATKALIVDAYMGFLAQGEGKYRSAQRALARHHIHQRPARAYTTLTRWIKATQGIRLLKKVESESPAQGLPTITMAPSTTPARRLPSTLAELEEIQNAIRVLLKYFK
jgi:hypothetical protein